jgi:hypothetical protein
MHIEEHNLSLKHTQLSFNVFDELFGDIVSFHLLYFRLNDMFNVSEGRKKK